MLKRWMGLSICNESANCTHKNKNAYVSHPILWKMLFYVDFEPDQIFNFYTPPPARVSGLMGARLDNFTGLTYNQVKL